MLVKFPGIWVIYLDTFKWPKKSVVDSQGSSNGTFINIHLCADSK